MKRLESKQMEELTGGLTQIEWMGMACTTVGVFSLILLLTPAAPVGTIIGAASTIGCGVMAVGVIAQDAYYRNIPHHGHGISAGRGDLPITTHHSLNGDETAATTDGTGNRNSRGRE